MTFITHLATSFEVSAERYTSPRERAKVYARQRLAGRKSVFDTLTAEQAREILSENQTSDSGVFDANTTDYEAPEL